MGKCDKCGENVPSENSALELDEIVYSTFLWNKDRHLYPTSNCKGSPSRVRLIESGDQKYTAAYAYLQQRAHNQQMQATGQTTPSA